MEEMEEEDGGGGWRRRVEEDEEEEFISDFNYREIKTFPTSHIETIIYLLFYLYINT